MEYVYIIGSFVLVFGRMVFIITNEIRENDKENKSKLKL